MPKTNKMDLGRSAAILDGLAQIPADTFSYPASGFNWAMYKTGIRNQRDYENTADFFKGIRNDRPYLPDSWNKFLHAAGEQRPGYALAGEVLPVVAPLSLSKKLLMLTKHPKTAALLGGTGIGIAKETIGEDAMETVFEPKKENPN